MSTQGEPSTPDSQATTAFNEAYQADGSPREHWRYLLQSLSELGQEEFKQRQLSLERILRDDGATYNDYSEGLVAKPWSIDPIPLLIDSSEWNDIETGIRERAELMDLILRDLYSERTLLSNGVIPPELIFSHPGFLRECQGLAIPGEQQLIQYAIDMARAPNGDMTVISDRTQTPSGTGYALENRIATSRVFPSLFRDSHVHRLSLYFNSLRLTLNALNPNGGAARVALLTPGAFNETYFEHVFLANFLGYQLVQGSDLTVRDGYLWLKTLEGLSRIDVLMRRVDDYFCDPVELRSDSRLGVPGLLEVMRLGNVAVVNPLGSGILENRGLARYMPAAARHFLGRDLRLPTVPSYWCGDAADRDYVLANINRLVIKTTYRGPQSRSILGTALTAQEQSDLRDAIEAEPLGYVAQEFLQPSSSPVWGSEGETQLPLVLRGFAVAGESSYTVMPGGLTRVGAQPGMFEITNRVGSLSKDTWVLASEPERRAGVQPVIGSGDQARSDAGMELPSRVVENLFWFGRYTERTEGSLRLVRTVFNRLGDEEAMDAESRALLLRAVTHLTCTYPGFMEEKALQTRPEQELFSVVLDAQRSGSVVYSMRAMLNAVAQVKDYMSADAQRILNDLNDAMGTLPLRLHGGFTAAPAEELGKLVTALLALSGLAQESMVRGQGWRFMDMGRRIERGLQTISLLRAMWVPVISEGRDHLLVESALLSTETLMTYRRRYQGGVSVANGLDLLLVEPSNPRALVFQLDRLAEHLGALPAPRHPQRFSDEQRALLEAASSLRLARLDEVAQPAPDQYLRSELDQLLSRMQHLLGQAASAINDRYFDHTTGPHPMGPADPDVDPDTDR